MASAATMKARRCPIVRLPSATDLSSLRMPSLHCTFPALVHVDYPVVKEQCDAWIEAVAKPPSAAASRFLQDCLLPRVVCRIMPKAISQQRLVHAIKAIAWLLIADTDDDHPDMLGSDYTTTSHRAACAMAILRAEADGLPDTSFHGSALPLGFASKFARMLKALADLWHEIRQEMSSPLQTRFISAMANYFEALKVQASFRKEGSIPDVESYMEIRRQASFTIPSFILMEYCLGLQLDESTLCNPLIQELHDVALDHICLCNDVVSCCMEIKEGDYFNLPFVMYNSTLSFTSFQNVVDHVAQMVQDLNNRASFLMQTIQEENKDIDSHMLHAIHSYVEGLSHIMSGSLAWHFESARYHLASCDSELH